MLMKYREDETNLKVVVVAIVVGSYTHVVWAIHDDGGCSTARLEVWVEHETSAEVDSYHVSKDVHVVGAVDQQLLRRASKHIIGDRSVNREVELERWERSWKAAENRRSNWRVDVEVVSRDVDPIRGLDGCSKSDVDELVA